MLSWVFLLRFRVCIRGILSSSRGRNPSMNVLPSKRNLVPGLGSGGSPVCPQDVTAIPGVRRRLWLGSGEATLGEPDFPHGGGQWFPPVCSPRWLNVLSCRVWKAAGIPEGISLCPRCFPCIEHEGREAGTALHPPSSGILLEPRFWDALRGAGTPWVPCRAPAHGSFLLLQPRRQNVST